MRAKEFVMKDLYTFDIDREASLRTYEEVNEAYSKFLSTIGVPFLKGTASNIPAWITAIHSRVLNFLHEF